MGHETISPYGRGICSVCEREMNLRKNGTIRHHGGPERGMRPYGRTYRCTGSDQPPASLRGGTDG